jgi:tetratricopeptide (TPR) repeat protein
LLAGIEDARLAGAFYASLGWCEFNLGLYDSSIDNSQRGAELYDRGGDTEGVGRALNTLQFCYFAKGDMERAVALKEEIVRKMGERAPLRRTAIALFYASLAYSYLGRWEEALRDGREVMNLGQEYSDDSLMSEGAFTVCVACTFKGDLDRAIEYGDLAARKAPTPLDSVMSQAALAWAMCRRGESERSIHTLAELVQAFRSGGLVTFETIWSPLLAEGYLIAGEYNKSREVADHAVELTKRHGAKFFLGWAHRLLGEIALKTNPNEAPAHFQKAVSIFSEIKTENDLALAYSGMGRFHKQQGNTEQARESLSKALEIFVRLGSLLEPDKVRKELAELPETG